MKSVFLQERNLDSMWFRLLYEVYHHGRKNPIHSGSYAGSNRLEFDFVSGTITNPTERPLAPMVPEGVPRPTTDQDIENYFVNYIMNSNLEENEHYRYATWIVGGAYKIPKFRLANDESEGTGEWVIVPNQLDWVINHYKKKGFGNNHCTIQIGYPESKFAYDILYKDESERQTSPCLQLIDTHIKDNKLHTFTVFRSWDLYGGLPENLGGITLLMEYIANELSVDIGPLSFSSLKLHVYDFQINALKARLNLLLVISNIN